MDKSQNVETIAVRLTAATGKYTFTDNQNMVGRKVKAIETHLLANVAKSPNGETVCNANAQKCAFLTLQIGGMERIKDIPLNSMVLANRNGNLFEIDPSVITLPKSYVSFSDVSAIVTGEVLLITFYFD